MPYTAFEGHRRLASGSLAKVAPVALASNAMAMVFDDDTGRIVDLDPRETYADPPRTRGRPKLGVSPREVTLLPRHWDWLAAQPGGASAALRRLVDTAQRVDGGQRARIDAAYRVMSAIGGDLPHFEAASRALFAGDLVMFGAEIEAWPKDVRAYILSMLNG